MQHLTVMVVDDEIPYCEVMKEIIRSFGCQVITAHDPERAWQLLQKHIPDIILMDVMMPNMDGLRFTRDLIQKPKFTNIPIVIVSAKASDEDRQRAQMVGAAGFLEKPFTSKELRATLEQFLISDRTN
jgi:CheY-like chemotaxis protein